MPPAPQLAIEYGLKGPNQVVVTACASATNAIGDAYKLIRDDDADVIVTGGSEAALTHIGLSAFSAMRALSERNDEPTRASRPFDRDRDGFVLSEGAGLAVLEEYEHAVRRGARIYGEVYGYGCSCDGGHITAPDKDGVAAAHAMALAIKDGGSMPATSTISTPTAQAPRWAIRRKPRPSSRSSRNMPNRSVFPARKASLATSWAPAGASS